MKGIDARTVVSALVLVGYLVAARGVDNFYPVSSFPMYASAKGTATSRVMALTQAGDFAEVTAFESWQCGEFGNLDATFCEGVGSIPYIDREREAHVRGHPGTGGAPIQLVRRVFSFDGKTRRSHCVLAQCTAVRK